MEKKHTGKIIGLMVLMFLSSYGGNIETLLQANVDYDLAGGYAFLYSLLFFCGATLIAMTIPLVCRLVKGRKLSHKWGRLLCVVNSIIAVVISAILQEMFDILFVGGIGAIIYYFINKWLFVDSKEQQKHTIEKQVSETQMSLSFPDEKPVHHNGYTILAEDIRLEQDSPRVQVNKPIEPTTVLPVSDTRTPSAKGKVRYCSLCGNRIDNESKKCTGCGKQYFKRISWTVVLLAILVMILSVVLVVVITSNRNENSNSLPQKENTTA